MIVAIVALLSLQLGLSVAQLVALTVVIWKLTDIDRAGNATCFTP